MVQFLSYYLVEASAACEVVLGGVVDGVLSDHGLARVVMSVLICAVFLA
jgi:hypothetical protein